MKLFNKLFASKQNKKLKFNKNKKNNILIKNQQLNKIKQITFASHFTMGEGHKKNECQDTLIILDNHKEVFNFFAIFDGHGTHGKEASNAASDNFQLYLEKKFRNNNIQKLKTTKEKDNFMKSAFKNTEKKLQDSGIDYTNSGTCCIAVLIIENSVTISNLGDSRAVLYRVAKKKKKAIELSHDHKPLRKSEKERIKKKNGRIEKLIVNGENVGPYRVWIDDDGPGIAMTRTLGDFQAKKIGLISDPEIKHIDLERSDKFIVIASDGVWDVMSSAEVVGFILYHEKIWFEEDNLIAEKLVYEARNRWEELNVQNNMVSKIGDYPTAKKGIDDISVVICFFHFEDDEESNLSKKDDGDTNDKKISLDSVKKNKKIENDDDEEEEDIMENKSNVINENEVKINIENDDNLSKNYK